MRKLLCMLFMFAVLLSLSATAVEIDSADDIIALMHRQEGFDDLSATYTLTCDIDLSTYGGELSQKPIAPTSAAPFSGTFDGGGHTISGIDIAGGQYSGLFGIFSGTVKNLTVKGTVSSGNANDAGGIAGLAYNGASIIDCTNECTVSGKNSIGGIVGRLKSGSFTVSGCINKGAVSGVREVGGIAGYADPSGTLLLSECKNLGNVTLTGAERAGGILGATSTKGTVTVERCVNGGAVRGAKNIGGIVGLFQGLDTANTQPLYTLKECLNTAAITSTATSGAANVGGIAGLVKKAGGVSDCLNTGKVTSTVYCIGGVIGATDTYAGIAYCLSRCSVSCPADSDLIGVFGGNLSYRPDFANFYTSGTVGKIYANVAKYAYSDFATLNTNGAWANPYAPELAWLHTHDYAVYTAVSLAEGCRLECDCGAVLATTAHVDADSNNVCDNCGMSYAENLDTVYVSDGGMGDGTTAEKAISSLTSAYNALGVDGGEIVIVGTATVPKNRVETKENAFVEPMHNGKVTLRGADSNAVLRFSGVYQYHMSGETEFRNLQITSASTSAYIDIAGRGNALTMGEGLTMGGNDLATGTLATKIIVYGGCREGAVIENAAYMNPCLTVKSGSYYAIRGFNRTVDITSYGKATLSVGGDVYTKYLEAGSTSYSHFAYPAGAEVRIIGDVTVASQLSLGNPTDNQYDFSFDTDLYLLDGTLSFTGSGMDWDQRERMSTLDIFVDPTSANAVQSYLRYFAGYGDIEAAIGQLPDASVVTTEQIPLQNGVYTYQKGDLRVTVLFDSVIRIEESEDGTFIDRDTLMVTGRDEYTGTYVTTAVVGDTVVISTNEITVNIPADSENAADVRIFDKAGKEIYNLFCAEKNAFYSELPMPSDTPDALLLLDNGILPPEYGLTYTGSTDAMSGWTRTENIDMYVLLPMGDAVKLRTDFVTLTGRTALSDVKALGSWYSKWTTYTDEEKLAMIQKYRDRDVPLDMIVIDTEWKNTSQNGNDGDGTGYEYNTDLYPDMPSFLAKAEEAGVLVLFNDHTHQTSLKITDPTELAWQSNGIRKVMADGLDGWWYDRNWSFSIKSPFRDVNFETIGQVLYYDTMAKHHRDTAAEEGGTAKRVLMLSNLDWLLCGYFRGYTSLIGHRYGIQWTGDIYGDPLMLHREIINMVHAGANGSSPYLSSDLGGFRDNDAVTENMFTRWMQYGAFSPAFRVHSSLGVENEHLPWSYSESSEAIVRDFLHMRYHLMPMYYSLARENYDTGLPLARRLDFYYPAYAEAEDETQYLLGKDVLVAPYWSASGEGNAAVPSAWLKTPAGEQGLTAEYYISDGNLTGLGKVDGQIVLTDTVPNIDYYWHRDSAIGEQWDEEFSIRFTGTITPDTDCYIGIYADNGARVYINDVLHVDAWKSSGLETFMNTETVLKAGTTYDLTVDYYEVTGQAQVFFVYEPVHAENTSVREVFIPDGEWIDIFTGEVITGPKTVTVTKSMEQIPIYVRRGALLPAAEVISPMTGADWQNISLNLYGLGDSSFTLYEDDGATEGYIEGDSRTTDIAASTKGEITTVTISAAHGDFTTDYTAREVTLRVHSDSPITSALVNGVAATITRIEKDASATPFANSGASNISDVYEVSFTASLDSEHTVLLSTSETSLEPDMLLGDIDCDGKVMINDALLLLKAIVNESDCNADMNADGRISLIDVVILLKAVVA